MHEFENLDHFIYRLNICIRPVFLQILQTSVPPHPDFLKHHNDIFQYLSLGIGN